jgi:heat shock protein HslJ
MRTVIRVFFGALLAASLVACGLSGAPSLAGTRWVLTGIEQNGAPRPLAPGAEATLEFTADEVRGRASCNSYSGGYRVIGGSLTFEPLAATEMACLDGALMEQEAAFLGALAGADSFSQQASELTISGGGATLRFRPA